MAERPNKIVDTALPPIIIIKKKKNKHSGHHGGAWKVAYADFVTAMMALFIVLWLLSSSEEVKKAIGGYFQDPRGTGVQNGIAQAGTGESLSLNDDDMEKLKDRIAQAIKRAPEFDKLKDQVDLSVTGEGLRIELMESDKGSFFESGRPQPTKVGRDLIVKLGQELGKLPNRIMIEGHTDSKPFAGDDNYSNWELSTDRANAARQIMKNTGLTPGQVTQVRGFADQSLRKRDSPQDPSNRRVSVIVQYITAPPAPAAEAKKTETAKPEMAQVHGK